MTVDKALLFQARLPEAEVPLDGLGTVRVRGLSRAEVLELAKVDRVTPGATERWTLALALLDPVMTEDEVGEWQRASRAGEMQPVVDKVNELSALDKGQQKEAWKEFESDPDAEFHVPAGSGAGDDGGAAPSGDER